MPYKVFFVEDEIVTREGIRDNVDWQRHGFEFCGEASDGEMALPLIQSLRPDVLITDIKMPFMDGLQLCKIIRERMSWVKIIIFSGHDEFDYAQKAIKLGVTEYLLKPITVQDFHNVLQRIAVQIDTERREQESVRKLQAQVQEYQTTLKEKFLLKLVLGELPSTEAIEQSQALNIDLVARFYQVTVIRIERAEALASFNYPECHQVRQTTESLVEHNPDVFLLEKDPEELVLILKGNTPEFLLEENELLLKRIEQAIHGGNSKLVIASGTLKKRIADIYQSFIEAMVNVKNTATQPATVTDARIDGIELLKIDQSAVEHYLMFGAREDFARFFDTYIRRIGETACRSSMLKNYIFIDLMVAVAKFVNGLGGNIDQVIPNFSAIGSVLANIRTIEQIRFQVQEILMGALAFRDSQTTNQYAGMIQRAKEYIAQHFLDPELSLNQVANQVNLSPSHFSAVFSQECGTTFKEYVTEIRIRKAKELLRTTAHRSSEISYKIGYNDPHYFSHVFRKATGLSPREFRLQAQ
ncbi:MAG: response regulator transcription factor [Chloroflexi bacterium]|nr:response regulator transcription factor [Chloroflexota bacterium]